MARKLKRLVELKSLELNCINNEKTSARKYTTLSDLKCEWYVMIPVKNGKSNYATLRDLMVAQP